MYWLDLGGENDLGDIKQQTFNEHVFKINMLHIWTASSRIREEGYTENGNGVSK